jgi:hypothetical protein
MSTIGSNCFTSTPIASALLNPFIPDGCVHRVTKVGGVAANPLIVLRGRCAVFQLILGIIISSNGICGANQSAI